MSFKATWTCPDIYFMPQLSDGSCIFTIGEKDLCVVCKRHIAKFPQTSLVLTHCIRCYLNTSYCASCFQVCDARNEHVKNKNTCCCICTQRQAVLPLCNPIQCQSCFSYMRECKHLVDQEEQQTISSCKSCGKQFYKDGEQLPEHFCVQCRNSKCKRLLLNTLHHRILKPIVLGIVFHYAKSFENNTRKHGR